MENEKYTIPSVEATIDGKEMLLIQEQSKNHIEELKTMLEEDDCLYPKTLRHCVAN